jgi:AsmA protein
MIKLVKLLLGFTVLLVVIVAIVLVGAVLFFDPNQHKDFIVSQVEKNTGREFTLAGNINLSYYPWLGVEAEGVTLGNATGFGDELFLHADAIALRIKTMPLLSKKYELDTLKLQGLKLNLAKNEDGISNWDDLTGKQVADQAPQKTREPFQLAAVILGGVDVKNALITWSDQSTGQKIVVSNLNATTGELTYGDPINLAIDLKAEVNKPLLSSHIKMKGVLNYNLDTEVYAFKPIDLLATISGKDVPGGTTDLVFKAAMETNLDAETFTVSGLSLDVLGTSIRGDLAANNIKSGEPSTKAKLTIKSDDLAKLFQLVDPKVASELATLADRSMDMKLSLESDLQQDLVRVSDMDIKVLGAIIQGQVEANNLKSDKPAVKGKLKAMGPDLPAIMQIIGQFEAGDDPKLKNLGQQLAKVKDKSFNVVAEFDANLEQGNILVPNF